MLYSLLLDVTFIEYCLDELRSFIKIVFVHTHLLSDKDLSELTMCNLYRWAAKLPWFSFILLIRTDSHLLHIIFAEVWNCCPEHWMKVSYCFFEPFLEFSHSYFQKFFQVFSSNVYLFLFSKNVYVIYFPTYIF